VTTVAGVLCTRVRMEEKRMIAALTKVGVVVKPLPPTDSPLPIQPLSASAVSGEGAGETVHVVIDRLQERLTAAVWLPYWRQPGREVIDAGVAATLDRLAIARILAEAGLPRPETALVVSESSGLNAIELFEGTGTLLPLQAGTRELPLLDRESAEAVLEHREVLGEKPDAISLMQQGVATKDSRLTMIVIDGVAVAASGNLNRDWPLHRATALGEEVARVLGARLIGVSVAEIDGRLVIWDVLPTPEFREAAPLGDVTVEEAICALVQRLTSPVPAEQPVHVYREETGDHVVLSA
jgi:[lysine-biosynthesis-protein LysW]---L-2-aminoadipate ligase